MFWPRVCCSWALSPHGLSTKTLSQPRGLTSPAATVIPRPFLWRTTSRRSCGRSQWTINVRHPAWHVQTLTRPSWPTATNRPTRRSRYTSAATNNSITQGKIYHLFTSCHWGDLWAELLHAAFCAKTAETQLLSWQVIGPLSTHYTECKAIVGGLSKQCRVPALIRQVIAQNILIRVLSFRWLHHTDVKTSRQHQREFEQLWSQRSKCSTFLPFVYVGLRLSAPSGPTTFAHLLKVRNHLVFRRT